MEEYKKFAIRIAKESGEIMKKYFMIGVVCEYKKDNSPVTQADLEINSFLINEVSRLFPEHSINGEEKSNTVKGSKYVWVCDPIDGTIPYSRGMPISTFSLALVKNGEVVLGVVYDPFCDRLFSAEKNKGSYLNDQKIHVSDRTTLNNSKIDCEMFNSAKYDFGELIKQLKKYNIGVMRLSSFIYPSVLLAAGEFDITLFPHTTAHDAATVKIIVEEAGGKVTDIFGNEQRYDQPINGLLVSNGILHNQLVALTKQFVVIQNNTTV